MVELEKKVLLSEQEYLFLKQLWFCRGDYILQTNRYYDTEDRLLCCRGITCRIREKGGKCKATIKNHRIKRQDASLEYSVPIKGLWDDGIFRAFGLFCQGMLTTERIVLRVCNGVAMMLDRNQYLNTVDYELEIEYSSAFRQKVDEILAYIANTLEKGQTDFNREKFFKRIEISASKSSRFFDRLDSTN